MFKCKTCNAKFHTAKYLKRHKKDFTLCDKCCHLFCYECKFDTFKGIDYITCCKCEYGHCCIKGDD